MKLPPPPAAPAPPDGTDRSPRSGAAPPADRGVGPSDVEAGRGDGVYRQPNSHADANAGENAGENTVENTVENAGANAEEDNVDDTTKTFARHRAGAAAMPPVGDRAHIVNKDVHAQKILAGPGSLDPSSLATPTVPDVRRWLAKRGIELAVPAGWRFMGISLEGRSISFNHTGTIDGHSVDITTWRLADDTPIETFLAPYLEEAEELTRLGRLGSHEHRQLGNTAGVLLVGFGPDSKEELAAADEEALFLATDGTGRRMMSWRGATARGGERQLTIVAFSSPIETFFEARPVFDAMLRKLRIVS